MEKKYELGVFGWIVAAVCILGVVINIGVTLIFSGISKIFLTWSLPLIFILPVIELLYKSFVYYYKDEEYEVSKATKILSVLSLGIPYLYYGMYSKVFQKVFNPEKPMTQGGKVGFALIAVFSFGMIYFINAVLEFVIKRSIKEVVELQEERLSKSTSVLLGILTVLTFGMVWLFMYMIIALIEFSIKHITKLYYDNPVRLTTASIIFLVIYTMVTWGIIWFYIMFFFGIAEIYVVLFHWYDEKVKSRIQYV